MMRMVARRRAAVIARVAAAVRAEFPDLEVAVSEAGVTLAGRRLWRRRLVDARLRGIVATVRAGLP